MAKISRPAVYTFVAAVAVYAVVLLTQPDPPAPHPRTHAVRHTEVAADGFLPEDLSAHFARYHSGKRDPFQSKSAGLRGAEAASGMKHGTWTLTGINTINGVPNALIEDSVTGDSVFLKPGDRWQGLRVLSIGTDAVAFLNALGQQTHLAFRPLEAAAPEPGQGSTGGPFHLQGLGTVSPFPVGPGNIRALPVLPPLGSPPAPQGR
ncbi:MAG: hypothetical protein ACRYFS_22235 [Janthinobacterium lividum]